jgi:AcrR family transcriptional regulator
VPNTVAPERGRRRGPSKGDLKEAAILDRAWDLLGTRALGEITVDELASGAGISRSTFYFYFDSKEAVLRALASRIEAEIRDAAAPFFGGGDVLTAEEVRTAVRGYLGRWKAKGNVLRASAALEATDPAMHDFWADISDGIVRAVADGVERQREAGVLPPGPPHAVELVRVLFGMLWRAGWEVSLRPPSRAEEQRLVDALSAVMIRAFTA